MCVCLYCFLSPTSLNIIPRIVMQFYIICYKVAAFVCVSVYRCVCVGGGGGGGGGQEVEVTFPETVSVERGYYGAISKITMEQ